ncbi:hypothetical protein PUN28_005664 [Cardiocondyla obscurior]|uniref:Uncharacterized protein n=1 Tax=Cardiocondyla obscurior TaxID=286306 RepID=A0AAW2GAJ0_9HYME
MPRRPACTCRLDAESRRDSCGCGPRAASDWQRVGTRPRPHRDDRLASAPRPPRPTARSRTSTARLRAAAPRQPPPVDPATSGTALEVLQTLPCVS